MKIALFQQYYIPDNQKRNREIIFCLKCNLKNKFITTIYLLNEREYTFDEMGLDTPDWQMRAQEKIVQIIVGQRLTYLEAFKQFQENKKDYDFFILANSDIFFDSTLRILPKYLNPRTKRSVCLGRWEYPDKCRHLARCKMAPITKNGMSQDSWIFHKMNLPLLLNDFDFLLGKLRCDNRIAFLLKTYKLIPINPCKSLRSYHFHTCGYRTYSQKDCVPGQITPVQATI